MSPTLLGDALELLVDHRGKTPGKLGSSFVAEGIPVLSAILVRDGRAYVDEARRIDAATYERWMPQPMRHGDVLLTSEAPLGRVARVPDVGPVALGQRLYGLRGRQGVLDNGFLFYLFQTEAMQAELLGRSTGTTVFGIRQSALVTVPLSLPPLVEQRAIADVLGALDDKIAANESATQSAEQLAVALAGTATTTAPVADLATAAKRMASPSEFASTVAHYSLPAFDAGRSAAVEMGASIKSSKFHLRAPSVLVSKLNPRIPRVWDVPTLPAEQALTSTEFVVLEPIGVSTTCLWAALGQRSVRTELASHVAGTSGSHQRVKPVAVMALELPDPRSLAETSRESITALGLSIVALRRETGNVAATRDALLPLLLSGKLRVREAEKVVSDVV